MQRANFEHRLQHEGEDLSLTEALETRKALDERLGELHSQVVDSAYEQVFHKEERDIVEENELPYEDCRARLDEARVEFRRLNRRIRAASFEVVPRQLDRNWACTSESLERDGAGIEAPPLGLAPRPGPRGP